MALYVFFLHYIDNFSMSCSPTRKSCFLYGNAITILELCFVCEESKNIIFMLLDNLPIFASLLMLSGHFISPSCPTFFITAGNENMALLLELYSVEGLCLCCWLWKRSCELMCLSVCCGDGTCDMKYSAILSWQPSWCCFFFWFWSFITFFFFLNDWMPFWRQEKRMVILLIW